MTESTTPPLAPTQVTQEMEIQRIAESSKVTNEEYKIWKKQSPFLYDISISKALKSPATSVEWFPPTFLKQEIPSDSDFESFNILMSTVKLLQGTNQVTTSVVDLPKADVNVTSSNSNNVKILDTLGSENLGDDFYPHMARYSPLNPVNVAVCGKGGHLRVFKGSESIDLKGHVDDVLCIDWSPHNPNILISGSADGTALLWDIQSGEHKMFFGDNSIGQSESRGPSILGVKFAPLNNNEFATVGDDRVIRFWDIRNLSAGPIRQITDAHSSSITSLDYSPFNEMLLATGSADGAVAIWDVRMSSASLIGIQSGAQAVNALKWSPHEESVFATASADTQVKIWDLSLHGASQSASEEYEGPPELLFIHGGHLASVTDLSWHPSLPWTICSIAEDCLIDIWKIASAIVDTPRYTSDDEDQANA